MGRTGIDAVHIMRPVGPYYSIERVYQDVRQHAPLDVPMRAWICPHPSRGIVPRIRGAIAAARIKADVFHMTGHAHYLVYFLPRNRTVLTIHDCEFLDRESGLKRWLLWLFWFWLAEKRCAKIIAISEDARERILSHLNCIPEKVVVISNPVSDDFRHVPKAFDPANPRILHIGTKQNKNLERLAAALEGLDVTLSVIGQLTDLQRSVLERHRVRYESRVGLSDAELRREYETCDMLAFCSTYEGFGLPIVEAQAVGRPVVTSRIAPMTEVAGDGACFVDPFDVSDIRTGIERVIHDQALRETLVARGLVNVERFRASTVARRYADLYEAVCRSS